MGWVSVCTSFWMHFIIELSVRKINASRRSIEGNSFLYGGSICFILLMSASQERGN